MKTYGLALVLHLELPRVRRSRSRARTRCGAGALVKNERTAANCREKELTLLALSGRRDRGIRQMAVVLGRRRMLYRVLLNRVGGLRLSHALRRRLYEFR